MRNKLRKVFGIGINDADYPTNKYDVLEGKYTRIWICPFYSRWKEMLRRCYHTKLHEVQPKYGKCSVKEEWWLFSTFKSWMETQDWEGKELDKDLLVRGNTEYGPETCIFVDRKVNNFILERVSSDRGLPTGVLREKRDGRYRASCKLSGTNIIIGRYNTPEEAHKAWLDFKLEQAYVLAAEQQDERVARALIERYENYQTYDNLN